MIHAVIDKGGVMAVSFLHSIFDFKDEGYFSFQKSSSVWPYNVSVFDDLPEIYKKIFPSYTGSFPYTILIPDENYTFFKKKGYLIVVAGQKLHIFEKSGSELDSIYFDVKDIVYFESGEMLLYSWIVIAGEKKIYSFNFHSAKEYLFVPVIARLRNLNFISDDLNSKDTLQRVQKLIDTQLKNNLKFRNLLYNQSIELEKIKDMVFQPDYLYSSIPLPCINYQLAKRYISNHLVLLTDEELIFIRECQAFRKKIKLNSDNVFTYVKLKNISSFEKRYDKNKNYYGLFFILKNGTRLSAFFSCKNIYVDTFLTSLKQSIKMF